MKSGLNLLNFTMVAATVMLSGCAVTPPTIVQHPLTAKPDHPGVTPSNGAIFQTATYRPVFEDFRARQVGDVIIMTINENTTAGKSAAASDSKAGGVAYTAPVIGSASTKGITGTSTNSFSDKGAITSSNNFAGTMGLTVLDVLPNGNLVVSGEKQISLDKSVEYIRFSGVISPDTIVDNTVSSTQVADARVEYRTDSRYDSAELTSELARFFMSLSPF